MTGAIKINGTYGAKVGGLHVFTYEGAERAYRIFLDVCYKAFSMESSAVLSDVSIDMIKLGYTWEQLEQMEVDYFESIA